MKNLQPNRDNLAKLADPRGLSDAASQATDRDDQAAPHFMGGLHSGETGPSEMLMELVYRLATETSPFITSIRDNVYVSVTPVADADGRDRNVDQFYCSEDLQAAAAAAAGPAAGGAAGGEWTTAPAAPVGDVAALAVVAATCALPYWGEVRVSTTTTATSTCR